MSTDVLTVKRISVFGKKCYKCTYLHMKGAIRSKGTSRNRRRSNDSHVKNIVLSSKAVNWRLQLILEALVWQMKVGKKNFLC